MNNMRSDFADILKKVLVQGESFSEIKSTIYGANRDFFNMLFMSVFRNLTFIKDEILNQLIKKKIPHKRDILEFILYLGITELLFLDTPDYAVINSYVEIAKNKTDKFGANFVNAVLRNVLRNRETFLSNRKTKFFGSEFLKILQKDYTPSEINEMESFAIVEPPLDLSFKKGRPLHIENSFLLPTGSLRLPSRTKISTLPYFDEGLWWVQDAASALAVKCIPSLEEKNVLDICAAPGGKTAQLLDAGASVTAVDISEKRLQRLKENIARLGLLDNLHVICTDALNFNTNEVFDVVLLDAPCSATGTFRRHPEIMHTKTLLDVQKQAQLQKNILNHVAKFVKPGGLLVYTTCSLAKAEGEIQMINFIKDYIDFQIIPIRKAGTENMQTKEGFLRILPQHFKDFSGIDGFFIAILKRKI